MAIPGQTNTDSSLEHPKHVRHVSSMGHRIINGKSHFFSTVSLATKEKHVAFKDLPTIPDKPMCKCW